MPSALGDCATAHIPPPAITLSRRKWNIEFLNWKHTLVAQSLEPVTGSMCKFPKRPSRTPDNFD